MQHPLQITFRHMETSEALEEVIHKKMEKLEHIYDGIIGCQVVIEAPHRHHQQGKIFHVRIDMKVPGEEIIINRNPSENHAHEDARVAVRDAFDAAKNQLQDYVQRRRGDVKNHSLSPSRK